MRFQYLPHATLPVVLEIEMANADFVDTVSYAKRLTESLKKRLIASKRKLKSNNKHSTAKTLISGSSKET